MTQSDFDCLAHVVIDPQAWYDHAVKTFGQQKADAALAAKVERWWNEYTTESAKPDYLPRAKREALQATDLTATAAKE